MTAATAMSRPNAPIDKTDWSPLRGKSIVIWPDSNAPGKSCKKLTDLDVFSLAVVTIPQNKPKAWNAADCIVESASISRFIKDNSRKVIFKLPINILNWNVDRCIGPVQKQKVVADCLLPLGVTSIVTGCSGSESCKRH
jgi:hypothetical protein